MLIVALDSVSVCVRHKPALYQHTAEQIELILFCFRYSRNEEHFSLKLAIRPDHPRRQIKIMFGVNRLVLLSRFVKVG